MKLEILMSGGRTGFVDYPPNCPENKCIVASQEGYSFFDNEANQSFVEIISNYKEDYAFTPRKNRNAMKKKIIEIVENGGYKFFKLTKDLQWVELNIAAKCEKVRKAMDKQLYKDYCILPRNAVPNKLCKLRTSIKEVVKVNGEIKRTEKLPVFQAMVSEILQSSYRFIVEQPDGSWEEYSDGDKFNSIARRILPMYDTELKRMKQAQKTMESRQKTTNTATTSNGILPVNQRDGTDISSIPFPVLDDKLSDSKAATEFTLPIYVCPDDGGPSADKKIAALADLIFGDSD